MNFKEVILTRRSQRQFDDYYVTDQELQEMIEVARFAPSWANNQCWELIIVRDKKLIQEVTDTYSKTNPARPCSSMVSVIIVALAKKNVSGCKEGQHRTKFKEWFMFDLGMAMQNISLMAHALGLGSVVVGSMDHDRCAKILKVPSDMEVVVALPVGRPVNLMKKAPTRKEVSAFVYSDIYSQKWDLKGENDR